VTSIATTAPIAGGTITGTGTITCTTCVTSASSLANHGPVLGQSGQATATAAAGTAHQFFASGGASADGAYQDSRDVKIVPFAACPNGTAAAGVSYASSQWTAQCLNNSGSLQAIPSTGATLYFLLELPQDWDTTSQPFLNIYFGSGANTSGTVIVTASTACVDVSSNGGASDNPSYTAESAYATRTMAVANRMWYTGAQFANVTSGNGCKALSPVFVKLVLSGTASSAINAYKAVVTIPVTPTIQAN
jgi:hypothetical protein